MATINLQLPADKDIVKTILETHNFSVGSETIKYIADQYLQSHISLLINHITLAKRYKRNNEAAFYIYLKRYLEVSSKNSSTSSLFLVLLEEINLQRIDSII